MKRIDIFIVNELFILRYSKKYNKQVLKCFCDYMHNKLKYGVAKPALESFWFRQINPLNNYQDWISSYDKDMLDLPPKDYAIRRDFKEYLLKYKEYICDERF